MLIVGCDEFDCSECRNEQLHEWCCARRGVWLDGRERCPVERQTEESAQWLRQYSYHRREGGPFWYPGSASEQPARYMRAMERLGHHVAKLEREHRAQAGRHLSGGVELER